MSLSSLRCTDSLHQRGENPQHVKKNPLEGVTGAFFQRDFVRGGERPQEIGFYRLNGFAAVQKNAAFKVQVQAAEIQIGSADRGNDIVADKGFAVVKARRVFIDLDPGGNKLPVI